MNSNVLVYAFCVTMVVALISWGFQIYVSRRLSKEGTKVGIPIGKHSWITPFVQGWQYAKQLEIVDVMVFWSIFLGMTFIGMIITLIALLAVTPPS